MERQYAVRRKAIFFRERRMKRVAWFASFAGLGFFVLAPGFLAAQSAPTAHLDHAEVGVYGDYLRYTPNNLTLNFVGLGALAGVNVAPHVVLEGQMSYDFARNYTTAYSGSGTGGTTTDFVTTRVRPLTGLFGPKLQFGKGGLRVFVTAKAGFADFTHTNNSSSVSSGGFSGAVNTVGDVGTHVAFYPGAGIEGFMGPFGLRVEAGDEVYIDNGAQSDLRVAAGPVLRF
jgi:hypothetical protein